MSQAIAIANVYMFKQLAGQLIRHQTGFSFQYDKTYLVSTGIPLSYSLPLQHAVFSSAILFPYFTGLLSEGWLLDLQSKTQQIDKTDHFALLLKNGHDLAGAVTIELSNLPEKS